MSTHWPTNIKLVTLNLPHTNMVGQKIACVCTKSLIHLQGVSQRFMPPQCHWCMYKHGTITNGMYHDTRMSTTSRASQARISSLWVQITVETRSKQFHLTTMLSFQWYHISTMQKSLKYALCIQVNNITWQRKIILSRTHLAHLRPVIWAHPWQLLRERMGLLAPVVGWSWIEMPLYGNDVGPCNHPR
jgi:hypothetical protein